MSMLVFLTLLGGCANTSQGEVPSIDYGSTETDTQMVEAQDETNINVKDRKMILYTSISSLNVSLPYPFADKNW